jgi:predicted metal-binding membrane protein
MLLLFVGGVMNLLWIAALGALVLAEKLIPGRLVQRAAGVAMIAAGLALLLGEAPLPG